ncbi:MAG TPA: tetratricopeptide repeat protein, partial [Labilithrix sp.]|nr:tetratricopeptide repeat protein [Labilithrix sp.]
MADGVDVVIAAVLAAAPRGQHVAALCAKGEELVASGDLDTALACFDHAVRLDVSHAAAWVGRARILSRRKRDNEALGCINRALDVDPRCADALVHKGHIMYGRGLAVEALAAYEAALGSGAGPDAREGRAAAMAVLGRTDAQRLPPSAPAPAAPAPAGPPVRAAKKSSRSSGRVDMRAEKKSIREEAPKSARGADRKSFTSDPLVAKKSDPSVVLGP